VCAASLISDPRIMYLLLAFAGIVSAHQGASHSHDDGSIQLPRSHQPGAQPQVFDLNLLTDAAKNDGAVSLDGSPGAYYFFQGAETKKWYIHQQGVRFDANHTCAPYNHAPQKNKP
jgi:hypothetical protein